MNVTGTLPDADRIANALFVSSFKNHPLTTKDRPLELMLGWEFGRLDRFRKWQTNALRDTQRHIVTESLRSLPMVARKLKFEKKRTKHLITHVEKVLPLVRDAIIRHNPPYPELVVDYQTGKALIKSSDPMLYQRFRYEREPEIEDEAQQIVKDILQRHKDMPPQKLEEDDTERLVEGFCDLYHLKESKTWPTNTFVGADAEVVEWLYYASECLFSATQYWLEREISELDTGAQRHSAPFREKAKQFSEGRAFLSALRVAFAEQVDTMASTTVTGLTKGRECWRPRLKLWNEMGKGKRVDDRHHDDPMRMILRLYKKKKNGILSYG